MSGIGVSEPLVRPMTKEDLPRVAELAAQLGYPVSQEILTQQFEAISTEPTHWIFVVEVGGAVAGYTHVYKCWSLTQMPYAQLAALVVDEKRRGGGLGRMLVRKVGRWSVEQGLKSVKLASRMKRVEAHAFYERLGFVKTKSSFFFAKEIHSR